MAKTIQDVKAFISTPEKPVTMQELKELDVDERNQLKDWLEELEG